MTSAGILSAGADIEIGGIKVGPQAIIIGTLAFVGLVKAASIFVK